MISKYTYKKITWIDIESPTREEMLSIAEEYRLPPLVAEELLVKATHVKVDIYPGMIYGIFQFPKTKHKGLVTGEQEIDFVVGKDFIITAHYELANPLHEFSKVFEVNSILERGPEISHAGFLFYYIMQKLYEDVAYQLEEMNGVLKEVERKIFEENERDLVNMISRTNRRLIDFRQSLRFHRETLQSFERAAKVIFGEEFSYYTAALTGEYSKVVTILDGHHEILRDLRETNDSLLSRRINTAMHALTAISCIMLPLTLITTTFAMRTEGMPLINNPFAFWYILGGMFAAALIMFTIFKAKQWF